MKDNIMNKKTIFFTCLLISSVSLFTGCKKKGLTDSYKNMVLVPEGEFIMGTNEVDTEHKADMFGIPKPWFEDERPERKIFLDAFYIDKYEVTNEEYKRFIEETDYQQPPDWKYGTFPPGEEKFPVTYVALYDAVRYAEWADKRIPSEEEWEKAARGPNGLKYPWGNTFDISKANLSKTMNNVSKKKEVGLYKSGVSPYGAFDMIGNVWEWTTGWYDAYEGSTVRKGDFGKKYKVIRGLSYFYLGHFPDDMYSEILAHVARASSREEVYPTTKSPDLGFRCIKYVKKKGA